MLSDPSTFHSQLPGPLLFHSHAPWSITIPLSRSLAHHHSIPMFHPATHTQVHTQPDAPIPGFPGVHRKGKSKGSRGRHAGRAEEAEDAELLEDEARDGETAGHRLMAQPSTITGACRGRSRACRCLLSSMCLHGVQPPSFASVSVLTHPFHASPPTHTHMHTLHSSVNSSTHTPHPSVNFHTHTLASLC